MARIRKSFSRASPITAKPRRPGRSLFLVLLECVAPSCKAANARLGAVCQTTDLLRFGMGFFDRLQYRLRVSRLSHSLCFLIDAIANERIIATGLFQKLY